MRVNLRELRNQVFESSSENLKHAHSRNSKQNIITTGEITKNGGRGCNDSDKTKYVGSRKKMRV